MGIFCVSQNQLLVRTCNMTMYRKVLLNSEAHINVSHFKLQVIQCQVKKETICIFLFKLGKIAECSVSSLLCNMVKKVL